MLAPPWIPVPPPGYGGIEALVAQMAAAVGQVAELRPSDWRRSAERFSPQTVAAAYEAVYRRAIDGGPATP
jgi:hypothetical protein